MTSTMDELFGEIGRDLFLSGAVTSHGGNLSMCDGESIWITRTGSQLGRLGAGDVICTGLDEDPRDADCSSELIVHRAIYRAMARRCAAADEEFGQRAIVHAHTAYTTLLSLYSDEIASVDSECKYLLPEPTPVITAKQTIGSPEVAQKMADLVEAGRNIAVIRNHGPFCIAKSLGSALQLISSLEHSCKMATLIEQKEAARKILEG
ncbi:MAG: class II aldolase/adducin family protein [bacterium]|nr:class II aldolase/adducin family protein [bacterium]